MRLSPRIRANRLNARKSTGPRTPAGKARAARNALRHGLNVALAADGCLNSEIERLARAIVGQNENLVRLDGARRIAEAQVDLIRIRSVRRGLFASCGRVGESQDSFSDCANGSQMQAQMLQSGKLWLEGGLDLTVSKLLKLNRYERRALSRRNAAIRDFERLSWHALTGPGSSPV